MSAQKWLFVKNFIKHPVTVSSIIPSSRFLMNRVLNRMDWERARTIIEFGPGVGNFTKEILKRMRPDARLGVIELNHDFVQHLRKSIPDPRLHVAHQSVEGVEDVMRQMGCSHVDYVISGIPFSVLPEPVREKVVEATHSVLSPDGSFMVYQFSRAVLPHLEKVFRKVEQEFEPLNVLPARLFYCAK
jgi:phospholipid N-methyltransferase